MAHSQPQDRAYPLLGARAPDEGTERPGCRGSSVGEAIEMGILGMVI